MLFQLKRDLMYPCAASGRGGRCGKPPTLLPEEAGPRDAPTHLAAIPPLANFTQPSAKVVKFKNHFSLS